MRRFLPRRQTPATNDREAPAPRGAASSSAPQETSPRGIKALHSSDDGATKYAPTPASDRSTSQQSTGHQQRQNNVGTVFRIRGVPLAWDADQLQSFVAQQEELRSRDGSASPKISSLSGEVHGRSKVATAAFRTLPPALQADRPWSTSLPGLDGQSSPLGGPARLTFDRDFHGLTTLYCPAPEDHQIEWVRTLDDGTRANASQHYRHLRSRWPCIWVLQGERRRAYVATRCSAPRSHGRQ
jgi:hypothetical protein